MNTIYEKFINSFLDDFSKSPDIQDISEHTDRLFAKILETKSVEQIEKVKTLKN